MLQAVGVHEEPPITRQHVARFLYSRPLVVNPDVSPYAVVVTLLGMHLL